MRTLIGLAQSGDTAARQRLAAALQPRLNSMARYYARCCREDYDDLLGEAWFAVFEALEITNTDIGEPEHFLLKRARWRILDYIKWARRRRSDARDDHHLPDRTVDVTPEVMGNALIAQVAEGLSTTQQVVLGCLLKGHTWREVAGQLGCSSANVAYHVRQIRLRCAHLVEGAPVQEDAM